MKTLLKSICYRIFSTCVTITVTFIIVGNATIALGVGLSDSFVKIFTYYGFDKMWSRLFTTKINPCVVWMTGLSGSGKTAISNELIKHLEKKGLKYVLLDGDEIRNVIKQTGFDYESRKKHNLNVAYMASLFEKQGNIVIVSLISPYAEVRDECRKICSNFIETYINTSIEECENRDVKGLYKKARAGIIKDFTGIDSPYEPPLNPEIKIDTHGITVEQAGKTMFSTLKTF